MSLLVLNVWQARTLRDELTSALDGGRRVTRVRLAEAPGGGVDVAVDYADGGNQGVQIAEGAGGVASAWDATI